MPDRLSLPGFVNAHSHAFQRSLRGSVAGGDFWAWREAMLELARRPSAADLRGDYEEVYREMRDAGYTAVGEFHYLGRAEAEGVAEAAAAAGLELVLLHAAYGRGGLERFRQPSAAAYLEELESLRAAGIRVGAAPHSVRACPREWLEEIGSHARREGLVVHVHACEQPREVEECLAEHGVRPIELLAETGCLGPLTTVVHATHADERELDLVAEARARVCLCPTTEASLGDGFPPLAGLLARGIPLCVGSDSNVRIDPLEELRELEGTARRQALRRGVVPPERLLAIGSSEGAAALGLERWDGVAVDLRHRSLRGVAPADVTAALVFGCAADVFV